MLMVLSTVVPVGAATTADIEGTIDAVLEQRPEIAQEVEGSRLDVPRGVRRQSEILSTRRGHSVRLFGPDRERLDLGIKGSVRARPLHAAATEITMRTRDSRLLVEPQNDGGVRIIAVIDSDHAAREYVFTAPNGHTFQLLPGGSAALLDQGGDPVAFVPAPWAVDAAGNDIGSSYTADADALVLHVAHEEATAYPVVADPRLIPSWWGWTLKLNRTEYSRLSSALLAGVGASGIAAIACGSSTAGVCAVPFAFGAAIITLGRGVLGVCANSRGVDIHGTYTFVFPLPPLWCSGY